jgi:hypothetical protein
LAGDHCGSKRVRVGQRLCGGCGEAARGGSLLGCHYADKSARELGELAQGNAIFARDNSNRTFAEVLENSEALTKKAEPFNKMLLVKT